VMINLLSNAIKFTQKGRVDVELIPWGKDEFRFIVRDTGIGIEEQAVGIIFERFRQVDGKLTRIAGGTGLGLSIVKQIVTLLGGQIDVSSKVGEGSVFTVTLPLVTKETPAIIIGSGEENGFSGNGEKSLLLDEGEALFDIQASERDNGEKPLVLIIEDDPDMASLLSETISRANYRVRVASNGIEGLKLARELDLSAILLDVMMPEMDGWKVLQALKAEPNTAQIPVIVCSIVDNRPLGYRLGASNYLIKPVGPEQLLSALQSVGTEGTNEDGEGYVLVVDDEHGIRELLTTALKKVGFNARSAASGETAIKMILQSPPKAIISDLMMPGGMSGYELIARKYSHCRRHRQRYDPARPPFYHRRDCKSHSQRRFIDVRSGNQTQTDT
jgi:CheY-like chemotaxis protein